MTDDARWFAGIDWASQTHQVCLIDADGKMIGERDKGPAEIHRRRRLRDRQAARRPIGKRSVKITVCDGDGELGPAAAGDGGWRDGAPRPQAEHQPALEREQNKGGRVLDRLAAEEVAIKGGARRRVVDVKDQEVRIGHRVFSSFRRSGG
jgi:hypothetical protein